MALAEAALTVVNEVLLVLPRAFPHKEYERVGLNERLELVLAATARYPAFSVAISDGGLFIEIARECRPHYTSLKKLYFLCGRDAAERIVNWDYGRPGAIEEQLQEFDLLVAPRQGYYEPPADLRPHVHPLPLAATWDDVSATEIRALLARGGAWQHLVPEAIRDRVARLYGHDVVAS